MAELLTNTLGAVTGAAMFRPTQVDRFLANPFAAEVIPRLWKNGPGNSGLRFLAPAYRS